MTELVVRHCAPTLAGLKTGSIVSCEPEQALEWIGDTRELLRARGLNAALVCRCGARALLLIYRERQLARELSEPEAARFLAALGYEAPDVARCVARLRERFLESGFPHEVGLFLGYPLEDVVGFIDNQGRDYKCCGCWKVYANEEQARRAFLSYNDCTRRMMKNYQRGVGLSSLIAANG